MPFQAIDADALAFVSGGDDETPAAEAPEPVAAPVDELRTPEPVLDVPQAPQAEAPRDTSQDGLYGYGDEGGVLAAADQQPAAPETPRDTSQDGLYGYGDEGGVLAAAQQEPSAPAAPVDPEAALRAMVPTPALPEAPNLDATTLGPVAPSTFSELDRFNYQVDIAQNYRDLASPPELRQANRSDCFNVAAINALTARDPEAVSSLATETRRPGVWDVATLNREGNQQNVYVNDTPLRRGGATTDDPALQAVYNATTQLYHPGRPGGSPADAMERLGATTDILQPADAVQRYQAGDAAVLATLDPKSLGRADPATQQAFRDAGLVDNHAYQVSAVIRHPDGRDYAVLTNPWISGTPDNPGNVHPRPIPVSDLSRFFGSGFTGRLR